MTGDGDELMVTTDLVRELRALVARSKGPGDDTVETSTVDEVERFFAARSLAFPVELRIWLSEVVSGSVRGPGGLYGLRPQPSWVNIGDVLDLHPEWAARGWIPVAGDGCGQTYVLLSRSGRWPVAFVEDDALQYLCASRILIFMRCLLLCDARAISGWPFEREDVAALDPDLVSLECDVRKPWQR